MRGRRRAAVGLLPVAVALAVPAAAAAWAAVSLGDRAREIATSALSAAFRREVRVGQISGDPWRGIVMEDVTIAPARPGRSSPLAVRRVTVQVDPGALIRGLLAGRGPLPSISVIVLEGLAIEVLHEADGTWNLSELLPVGDGEGRGAFHGRIHVLDGTVRLIDRARIAPGVFEARFSDVNGTADFARAPRLALRASFVEERGGERSPGRLDGAYTTTTRVLDLDVRASRLRADAWGPYLLTTPAFRITAGEADAAVHVLHAPAGLGTATDVSGRVTLRGAAAVVPDRAVVLRDVSGALEITDRWIRTAGLRGRVNGSPVEVRGEASFYGEPHVDLAVRSSGADLRALSRIFAPSVATRLAGTARGEVRIVGAAGAPRVAGRIEGARGVFDGQVFQAASGDVAFAGGLFALTGARGHAAGGVVAGDVLLSPADARYFLALAVRDAEVGSLRRWAPAAPAAAGTATGSFAAFADRTGVRAAGAGVVTDPAVADFRFDTVEGGLRFERGRLTLDAVQARRQGTWIGVSGQIAPAGGLALRVQATTPEVSTLPIPAGAIPAKGRADFIGTIGGSIRAPEVAGALQLGRGRLGPLSFESLATRLVARAGSVVLSDARARDGYTWYRAAGSMEWAGAGRLGLDVSATRASAATLAQALGVTVDLAGRLDGEVRIDGTIARPSASGSLSLAGGRVLGQRVPEASAAFHWDGRRLAVSGGRVHLGSSVVHVAGTFDRLTGLALDLATTGFDLRDVALPPLGASVAGTVDATGRITGPLAAPSLTAEAASANLTLNGRRFDHARGAIAWTAGTLQVRPLVLAVGTERYEIAGDLALSPGPRATLQATVQDGRLSTLLALGGGRIDLPLDGVVTGVASVSGPLANPEARLDLRLRDGRFGEHLITDGHVDLVMRNGSVTIEDLELRPQQGRIAATGRFDLRGASEIEVSGTDLDLDLVRPVFRGRRPLVGRGSFTMQLRGPLGAPEIGFDVEVARGGIEGMTFDSLVAGGFYRDGLLQISQAVLVQDSNRLRISGSVPFNPALRRLDDRAPVELRVVLLDVNLGLLRLLWAGVDEARGAVEGELRINGTPAVPRLSGGLAVRDGLVRLRGLATPIEGLRLDLRFEENTVRAAEASARLGGGTLRLTGAARVSASAAGVGLAIAQDAPAVLTAERVRLVTPPVADAVVNGSVRLWGSTGDVRRPLALDGRVALSEGTVVVAGAANGGAPRFPLALAGLRIDVGRDLAVQAGGLRFGLEPEGSLLLGGTLAAPTLEGTVAATRGTVTVAGNPFELLEGIATFQAPLGVRPRVFARARTQVGPTRIIATVRGVAPDALEPPELESDPPLPREQILALLGQRAGLAHLAAGDFSAALRAELTRRLFAPVTLAISRAIGLTELSVEYDFEQPLRLRLGKLLFSNLYLSATVTFEAQQQWLWALEYRFARGWELALRANQFGHREAILWYQARF
ncbi:MAG: translocation/assembly module TamB domain-containing protein [Armatimonadota bacterium]|nr:translocation/assembly module TamB domain-containing protein [Armatimonadota bacterium]